VRQGLTKVDSMLASAAGDFQHVTAVGKHLLQHGQDRVAILLAGFGVGFHDGLGMGSMT